MMQKSTIKRLLCLEDERTLDNYPVFCFPFRSLSYHLSLFLLKIDEEYKKRENPETPEDICSQGTSPLNHNL